MGKDRADNPERHWMKKLFGQWRAAHHLVLWIEEGMTGKRVRAVKVMASHCYVDNKGGIDKEDWIIGEGIDLDYVIDQAAAGKGVLTIWLPGGWDHLVLSGLADLIDKGAITYRYCSIDTHRVLLRGTWRGKAIIITSLANWTGGTWDSWRGKTEARGEQLFWESWFACLKLSRHCQCGSFAPSAGAAGILFWRSVLGPVVKKMEPHPTERGEFRPVRGQTFVGPLPTRPRRARNAERHCAYGLVHRQMRQGLVDEEIYCVDIQSAYLLGLCTTPLPIGFSKHLHKPSLEELANSLIEHTGCALVQIQSETNPYPVRQKGKVVWSVGNFWTWLAGAELANAVCKGHVIECQAAYLWSSFRIPSQGVPALLELGECLKRSDTPLAAPAWRSMYSMLVGRFAAWRREWRDCTCPQSFGRWSTWFGMDAKTGQPVAYRSIAGRVQKLVSKSDAGDSVALLFSCVTAQVRWLLDKLSRYAGIDEIIAVEADALWITRAGWQAILKMSASKGIPPDGLRCKERFDRAWMTGKSVAVVEIDGKKFLRCPGVPSDIAVSSVNDVRWPQSAEWHTEGGPDARKGVLRLERRYSIKAICKDFGKPAMVLPYADEIVDPALSETLLQPLGGERSEDDAES